MAEVGIHLYNNSCIYVQLCVLIFRKMLLYTFSHLALWTLAWGFLYAAWLQLKQGRNILNYYITAKLSMLKKWSTMLKVIISSYYFQNYHQLFNICHLNILINLPDCILTSSLDISYSYYKRGSIMSTHSNWFCFYIQNHWLAWLPCWAFLLF